jgi:integrase
VFGNGLAALLAFACARASKAWEALEPITLHEARHTFASLMIAAGVNAKELPLRCVQRAAMPGRDV